MIHDKYRATPEEMQEWKKGGSFDWSKRPTERLTPLITIDRRVSRFADNIREWVQQIANEHDVELTAVEVVPHQWTHDENVVSATVRWTSASGTFRRVFKTKAMPKMAYFLIPVS